eukprot:TRINITY_DN14852_c0_g1_i1.p1 TRINITY_DN14852_c0_g1~~TRINITY_DN14852_c0_g1_i1.p1  ORF type:complete len:270 (+),score=53.66 TRINITY_DN14852_c0_g1_i1:80-889(+)
MGKHGVFVTGPAGSGKSTFCKVMQQHCEALRRTVHVVNLDPAAEDIRYNPSIDIRDLIQLEDVMEQMNFGPNGGLVFCMEFLVDNLSWLEDELGDYDDDYLIFDCPGQIELYTHIPVMKSLSEELQRWGYRMCCVHVIDSHFTNEPSKFISGTLVSLSAMMQVQLPHINVMTKMDLLGARGKKQSMERFFDPDITYLLNSLTEETGERFRKLNNAIGTLIEDYNMVSFVPLDVTDEDSISLVLAHIDNSIQYGEDLEPKEPNDKVDVDE